MSLADYLRYPFVQYAFVVGTLIALCSSFLGVVLVMKRYSFIGDHKPFYHTSVYDSGGDFAFKKSVGFSES